MSDFEFPGVDLELLASVEQGAKECPSLFEPLKKEAALRREKNNFLDDCPCQTRDCCSGETWISERIEHC